MNVLMLLTPKSELKTLVDTYSLRQGLEIMRAHGYTALPVIDKEGHYVGTVTEGDFLWHITGEQIDGNVLHACEDNRIREIIRKDHSPAVNVSVDMDTLVEQSMRQNFVPVVDDRGTFIGIVTRQSVIKMLRDSANKQKTDVKI